MVESESGGASIRAFSQVSDVEASALAAFVRDPG